MKINQLCVFVGTRQGVGVFFLNYFVTLAVLLIGREWDGGLVIHVLEDGGNLT